MIFSSVTSFRVLQYLVKRFLPTEKEDINALKVLSPVVDRPLSVDKGETFDFCF